MNRREFFALFNPFREEACPPAISKDDRNRLYLRAMSKGIDPSNMDQAALAAMFCETPGAKDPDSAQGNVLNVP